MSAAVRDQRISRNPCDGVSRPRLPDHRQRLLTMAELQDLADRAGAYRLMILVLGAVRAAARRVRRAARPLGRSDAASASRVRVGVGSQRAHDLVNAEDAPIT